MLLAIGGCHDPSISAKRAGRKRRAKVRREEKDRAASAKIRAGDTRQQKHDKRDARLLLQLLVERRFPRIWTPSREQRDLRQLLIHRHKLVRMRVQVQNGLQHLAMNQGVLKKHKLWSKAGQQALRELPLGHPAVLSDQFSEIANYL